MDSIRNFFIEKKKLSIEIYFEMSKNFNFRNEKSHLCIPGHNNYEYWASWKTVHAP